MTASALSLGDKILLIYPVPSNDNKKDYELSVTDFSQVPPDLFAALAHGKNADKNYHQIVIVSSSAKSCFKKNWLKGINQLLPPEATGKKKCCLLASPSYSSTEVN